MKNGLPIIFILFFLSSLIAQEPDPQQLLQPQQVKPLPIPEYHPPLDPNYRPPTRLAGKTREDDAVFLIPDAKERTSISERSQPSPESIYDQTEGRAPMVRPRSFNQLSRIEDPSPYPLSANVKLIMYDANGQPLGSCSGTLIGDRYVLTAGHCLHEQSFNGWVGYVGVYPAYDRGPNPSYGGAAMKEMRVWNGWLNNQDFRHDMGVIILERPLGVVSGYLGYGYDNNDNFFLQNTFANFAYPGERFDGEEMYGWQGNFDFAEGDHLLYHDQVVCGGMSGSGFFHEDNQNNRYTFGVTSHSSSDNSGNRAPPSGYARVTQQKFADIQSIIESTTPTTADLTPLLAESSSSEAPAGGTIDELTFITYNTGKKNFNGEMRFTLYFSKDPVIDNQDVRGATYKYNGAVNSRQWKELQITDASVPGSLSPGDYHFGLVIENNDGNPNNNVSSVWDMGRIRISQGQSLTITPGNLNFNASGGNQQLSLQSNFSWSAATNASWLNLNPSTGSGSNSPQSITVTSSPNTSTQSRSATITFASGNLTETITVTQAANAATLTVTPNDLNFSVAGGNQQLSVQGNVAWTASGNAGWLDISPANGNGNATVTIRGSENTGTQARNATITFSGGGLTRTVSVQQEAPTASTAPWEVTPTGNSHTVVVQDDLNSDINGATLATGDYIGFFFEANGARTCGGMVEWTGQPVDLPVFGDDATTPQKDGFSPGETFQLRVYRSATGTEVPVNATFAPANGVITHTDRYANAGLSALTALESQSGGNAPWQVTPTGSSHTVVVQSGLSSDIDGAPLANGDYIGFFYEANGNLQCGGMVEWNGNNNDFPVFGDDATTPQKDGFSPGETFQLRVYRSATGTEVPVNATFAPANGVITHTNQYAAEGLSLLSGLQGGASQEQSLTIQLQAGWNMISSNVVPPQRQLEAVFGSVADDLLFVKDGAGRSYVPELDVNGIGDWRIEAGYQVKMAQPAQLILTGQSVRPENQPIPIETGWQIIAYLHSNPGPVEQVLAPIIDRIDILKDNAGNTYIPALGINSIGALRPGQGYKLKANAATTLVYPSLASNTQAAFRNLKDQPEVRHFVQLDKRPSSHNATLILPAEVAETFLRPGDEIAVANAAGQVYGAARYTGEHLAITVWGDDENSPATEGLTPGEAYHWYRWNAQTGKEEELRVTYQSGDRYYGADDVEVLARIEAENHDFGGETAELRIYPNPAVNRVTVQLDDAFAEGATVRLLGPNGRTLRQYRTTAGEQTVNWQLADLPAGIYQVQMVNERGVRSRKLIKQ